jgi:hypothetical protein
LTTPPQRRANASGAGRRSELRGRRSLESFLHCPVNTRASSRLANDSPSIGSSFSLPLKLSMQGFGSGEIAPKFNCVSTTGLT